MNKDEIKKEFDKEFYVYERSEDVYSSFDFINDKVADWWLLKLDAYQSSLMEKIAKAKKELELAMEGAIMRQGRESIQVYRVRYKTLSEVETLIKEGKE